MTTEKIIFYASSPTGMLAPDSTSVLRLCDRLVREGHLRREEKRVMIPALCGVAAEHARASGLMDPEEHEAVIVTFHAV